MFRIRYLYVRTILAVLTLAFLVAAVYLPQSTAGTAALLLLSIATGLSWINPPGIFGWLIQAACPYCNGHVEWEIQQVPEPYYEVFTVRCQDCGRSKVELAYRPQ